MIIDLQTGTIYGHILYSDAADVILMGAHGESHMSMVQFSEVMTWPAEAPGWALMPRYSVFGPEPDATRQAADARRAQLAAYADTRRAQLAAYAESNGGHISWDTASLKPRGALQQASRLLSRLRGG